MTPRRALRTLWYAAVLVLWLVIVWAVARGVLLFL